MNGVPLETQLVIGIITFVVFYFLIKNTVKRISSNKNDGDTVFDLNKMSKRNRKKKDSK
jgi:hypothetical protein